MFDFLKRKRTERLWKEGTALLERGAYAEALDIARRLEKERYTGAFDLGAQAHAGLGQLAQAIEVLERGVAVAPDAWLNWELLGNYRSDAGDFEMAAAAYERALGCEQVWKDSIRLNQAILAGRRGDHALALATMDGIEDAELALHKADLRARLLLEAGQPAAAMRQYEAVPVPAEPTVADRECLARLSVTRARAALAMGKDSEVVRKMLLESALALPMCPEPLAELRELRNERSPTTALFGVQLDYELDRARQLEHGAIGFLRSGQAIADSDREAIGFFREIEGDVLLAVGDAPKVERLDDAAGALKGVVTLSSRIYYRSRD